jgi:xanthine dehydrogenase YagS FAD-binding subunit
VKSFNYAKPKSLEQVTAYLAKGLPGVRLMGGGTDLLGEIKEGTAAPEVVIDLKALPGLAYIRRDGDAIAIGATTTVAELAEDAGIRLEYPGLSQAANVVASPQLRNMGTVGGNLCQRPRCWYYRDAAVVCSKKGGSPCFAADGRNKYHALFGGGDCYAVHPSDLAPVLIAFEAMVVLADAAGEKLVPLEIFYAPPAADVRKETILTDKQILREVRIPLPKQGEKSSYIKFIERGAWDFAVVSAAVRIAPGGQGIRVVCGGVGTVPWRLVALEGVLKGGRFAEAAVREAVAAAVKSAAPLAENGYKVDILKTVAVEAILKAVQSPPHP